MNPSRQFLLFESDFLKNGSNNFFCFRRQGSVLGPLQDGQISLFPKLARKELFSFQVTSLTDAEKHASLQLRAKIRGFELSDEVCKFLLRHYPRDTHVLYDLLNLLDSASLGAHRKVTIPFIKEVIANARIDGIA